MTLDSDNGALLVDKFPRRMWIAWRKWVCAIRASTPPRYVRRHARPYLPDAIITPPGPESSLSRGTGIPDTVGRFRKALECSRKFCVRTVTALLSSARITTSQTGKPVSQDHSTAGRACRVLITSMGLLAERWISGNRSYIAGPLR